MKDAFYSVLSAVLIAVIPIVVKYVLSYFKAKTAELENRVKNDNVKRAIETANTMVYDIVSATSQAVVSKLKESGDFNSEKAQEIKQLCIECIKSKLSNEASTAINENFGDINSWIESKIESLLKNGCKAITPQK